MKTARLAVKENLALSIICLPFGVSLAIAVSGSVPDMKIAVMTCWQPDDNYGTQIQGFALQKYLAKIGNDVFLIQYHRDIDAAKQRLSLRRLLKVFNPYLLVCFLKNKLALYNGRKETLLHSRDAASFRKKYLKLSCDYYSFSELKEHPPEADAYIVGSDQVWNISFTQTGNLNAHFLNFGSSFTKRISYAASFGFSKEEVNTQYIESVVPLLSRFNAISVREKSGLEILNKCGIKNGVQVCDPTFLLSPDEYLSYFTDEEVEVPSKEFVFVYELASTSSLNIKEIKKWALENGLDYIYVTGHGKRTTEKCSYLSIPQWVKVIALSKYVITNSFHGTVFALLFHKPVAVYPLKSNYAITNSRLDILNELAAQNIVVQKKTFDEILSSGIDWERFEKNKDALRQRGICFLKDAL